MSFARPVAIAIATAFLLLTSCAGPESGPAGAPGATARGLSTASGAATGVRTRSGASARLAPQGALAGPASFDALAAAGVVRTPAPELARSPLVRATGDLHLDLLLGQPSFLWAAGQPAPRAGQVGRNATHAALTHLRAFAPLYRLIPDDLASAVVAGVHDTGSGPLIVTLRQQVAGIEVFRRELKVVMLRDQRLVALAGNLAPDAARRASGTFTLAREQAVALAASDLGGSPVEARTLRPALADQDGYSFYDAASAAASSLARPARLRPVLYDLGDRLEPSYYVEVSLSPRGGADSLYYAYVVSAVDGRLLYRHNLTVSDSFTYRVWGAATSPYLPDDGPQGTAGTPHPTGLPDGYQSPLVNPRDLTLQNSPFSYNDPWLPPGATETLGNNVDACADLFGPDGCKNPPLPSDPATADFRAQASAPGQFLHDFAMDVQPTTAAHRQAGITHLFYLNNFLHDWYYDAGFDEAAGNAQQDNFGRGGRAKDRLLAEAQDYSGRDNANMTTPADGQSPRMQMYLWDGNALRYLEVLVPAAIAGREPVGVADFGPQVFDRTGDLVATVPADACAAVTNGAALSGKVALIDRGTCAFSDKVYAAEQAGAVGAVIANNNDVSPDEVVGMALGGTNVPGIPVVMVSYANGVAMKAQLALPTTVTARLYRAAGIDRDAALDSSVVAHEWGHFISNRLIGDGNGLNTNQAGGLGEGWGDFHALLLAVRPEDAASPANANWTGVYATAGYLASGYGADGGPSDGYYYGIRRLPYSIDFAKNALTFQHITNGVPLPAGVPTAFGTDGLDNAEVHNAGEVWATMLWECYAALLRDGGRLTFAEAQDRMKRYLVAAYKATPLNPTFVEARDALLAVALAGDRADCQDFGAAFARRGIGDGAVAPARTSTTNAGVVESYVPLCANGAPTADAGIPLTVDERTPVTLDGSASSDPEGDPLTYAWTQTGGPGVTLGGATSAAPTFTAPDVPAAGATLTFSLVVTDALGAASEPATTTVTVNNVNRPPVADAGAPQLVDEGAVVALDGSASSDPDGEPLTYTWIQVGGPNVALAGATTVAPTFTAPQVGAAGALLTFQLVVTDALGIPSALATATVTVQDVNLAPTADAGTPQTVDEGAAVTLDGSSSADPEGGLLTYTWIQVGGPNVALAGATTVAPTFTAPLVGAAGAVLTFSLTVSDGTLTSGAATTTVTVRNVNQAPTAGAGAAQLVDEGAGVTLDGSSSADPDGDGLTYAWIQTGGPGVTLGGATTVAPTFTAPQVTVAGAVLTFSLTVSDGTLTSGAAATMVTVRNVNQAPTASAGPAQSVDEGAGVTLDGAGSSDPDGDALTYAWTQTGGPTVTLSDAAAKQPTFTAPVVDADTDLVFTLTVSDGTLTGAAATTTVTVRDVNRAPAADAGADQDVDEGATATLDGSSSSDPDGDALTYAWTQTGGPTVTLSDAAAAQPTFTAPAVEVDTELVFAVTVSDGTLTSAAATTTVTVRNVDQAPIADAGTAQTVDEGATVTLDGSGSSDPDGDALTYSWTQTGGPLVTLSDAAAAQPTFTAPIVDVDTVLAFALTVNDGVVDSVAATVAILVRDVIAPVGPTADAGPDQTVAAGTVVTLAGTGSTADGGAVAFSWEQLSGAPAGLAPITSATPSFTAPTDLLELEVFTFRLSVTDERGRAALDTVTVTVLPDSLAMRSGCGCRVGGRAPAGPAALLLGLALLGGAGLGARRRRRR